MTKDEATAQKFLNSLSMGSFAFEPDGNIPPDFALNHTIAVEARRLNENYFAGCKIEGLESVYVPLHRKLREVLASYDSRFEGKTYWVTITYKRPLQDGIRKIGEEIHKVLDRFMKEGKPLPFQAKVNSSIWLTLYQATPVADRVFRHGISSDFDSGGLAVDLYVDNISHCVQDKTKKIAPYKSSYEQWWLLLVDTIAVWDFQSDEIDQIKKRIGTIAPFDRLLMIDFSGKQKLLDMP